MVWVIAILTFLTVLGIVGYKKEQRQNAQFAAQFSDAVDRFESQIVAGNLKVLHPEANGYHPVRGEVVYAFADDVRDHDSKDAGRLIISNKAIVFETPRKSERLVYSSLSNVEAKRDGIEITRRKGSRRAFQLDDPNLLGLIVAAYRRR